MTGEKEHVNHALPKATSPENIFDSIEQFLVFLHTTMRRLR